MPTYYPMMVDLAGRRCLVVGGGRVAERKVAQLLDCGAEVTVVSPVTTRKIADLAARGAVRLARRTVQSGDLDRAFLAFAATDDAQVNQSVAHEVRKAGGLVNVADAPEACNFLVPSVVRRGDLTIAISTSGAARPSRSGSASGWKRPLVRNTKRFSRRSANCAPGRSRSLPTRRSDRRSFGERWTRISSSIPPEGIRPPWRRASRNSSSGLPEACADAHGSGERR